VFRRFVLADELLAEVSVSPATVDTRGELVEMAELAARIAAVIRPEGRG
jgi:hypothetical protein